MAIPQFSKYPTTLSPATFASDMDQMISEFPGFISALNSQATAFLLSLIGSSTTQVLLGVGTKTLTVDTGLGFHPGMDVIIAYTTTPTRRMLGTVVSYNQSTGVLVVDVFNATGDEVLPWIEDGVWNEGDQWLSSEEGYEIYDLWTVSVTFITTYDSRVFTDLRLNGKITESVYELTGTVLDPSNGSIQTKTLAGNTTFTETLASGQSLVLKIIKGVHAIVWPTTTWLWGAAPAIPTTGSGTVVLYKIGTELFGVYSGNGA